MSTQLPDDIQRLMDRLDMMLPPDNAMIGEANGDPLVEIARDIAMLPLPTLSEEALNRIEKRVRDQAQQLGKPRSFSWRLYGSLFIVLMVSVIAAYLALGSNDAPMISPTPSPEFSVTPVMGATITPMPVALIVEGPIQSIQGNTITVYNIKIELAPDDAQTLQIGDVVTVEAMIAGHLFRAIRIEKSLPLNAPIPLGNNGAGDDDD